jgi:hypothetical protein
VFGVGKAAVMPVHRWLPAAMVAPTPVSALLHAVAVVKAGVFTITKIVVYIFGIDFLAPCRDERLLVYLVGFTIIAASLVALRQTTSSACWPTPPSASCPTSCWRRWCCAAGGDRRGLHIVAHAFGKITLFFAAGAIYVAAKKTEITQLRGIGRRMPWTMTAFTIGALSMIGVPPTAGFVSKWYMIAGAFQNDNYFVLAVLHHQHGAERRLLPADHLPAFFDKEDVTPKVGSRRGAVADGGGAVHDRGADAAASSSTTARWWTSSTASWRDPNERAERRQATALAGAPGDHPPAVAGVRRGARADRGGAAGSPCTATSAPTAGSASARSAF